MAAKSHAMAAQTIPTALLVATLLGIGCASGTSSKPEQAAPSEVRASSALAGAALVLDVRNQDEYDRGHLEGAHLIPIAALESRLAEVADALDGDKSKKIVTYCASGRRSEKAKQLLEQHGYTNVVNGGGYAELK
ncbi:MAG TPA: rhodanese-like domain-containing protein [Polyangiales bacterium]